MSVRWRHFSSNRRFTARYSQTLSQYQSAHRTIHYRTTRLSIDPLLLCRSHRTLRNRTGIRYLPSCIAPHHTLWQYCRSHSTVRSSTIAGYHTALLIDYHYTLHTTAYRIAPYATHYGTRHSTVRYHTTAHRIAP
eukprot:1169207-Rhodomonas_salina.1